MNRGRSDRPPGSLSPPVALEQQPRTQKPNRLSRTQRRSQAVAAEPRSPLSDFKSPPKILGCRVASGFSGESPHNESDLQQDIVWDATSPSPSRLGRRGRRHGAVNISDIVNRIAPKHGRPEVAEPTLQQWIGDSAAIPCTPDVQVPKPKKKSPRLNGVDDLLKLARQFDFNMFRQDEDDVQRWSPEPQPAAEDDFDSLFDGPTQHVSGTLTPASSVEAVAASVSVVTTEGRVACNEFEDDWENDDLLNDSLVLEMTQNPLRFAAPQLSSTQKPALPRFTLNQSDSFGDGKVNVGQRETFRLESNSRLSDTWTNSKLDSHRNAAGREASEQKPIRSSSHMVPAPSICDVPDDDLESFFSSDPVWDDPADDDLLREMCEDLENRIQSEDKMSTRMSNHRAALQPSNRNLDNKQTPTTLRSVPAPPLPRDAVKPQFTFKKPNNPVAMVTNKAPVKCSAAEIELKKQQAMERRRRRLQAAQNLRAPT